MIKKQNGIEMKLKCTEKSTTHTSPFLQNLKVVHTHATLTQQVTARTSTVIDRRYKPPQSPDAAPLPVGVFPPPSLLENTRASILVKFALRGASHGDFPD